MIIPGGRYPYDGDVSAEADWIHQPEAELVWRNVLVYEKMEAGGSECNRIVRFKGKDAATAFPLLEKPEGGPLNKFLAAPRGRMYLESETGNAQIAPIYLPLVYRWAFQILSALTEIYHNGIIHMDIVSPDCFWLHGDLSIALVGFQSADFVNLRGERVQGDAHCGEKFRYPWTRKTQHERPTAKVDLFDWASLVYSFMTDQSPVDGRIMGDIEVEEMISREALPALEEEKLGKLVKRCWLGEYESALDIMADLKMFLTQRGFRLEEDGIRGFDFRIYL